MPEDQRRYIDDKINQDFEKEQEEEQPLMDNNNPMEAEELRRVLKRYFMSPEGAVPWQHQVVLRRMEH